MTAPSWTARMIAPDEDLAGAPLLRREFRLDAGHGEVTDAALHATAHGVVTASVNGDPVSDDVLTPGWTSYEWRLRYRSYDVTELVRAAPQGLVVLGLALGNGWFRGRLGWSGGRAYYGCELGALAQLEIAFADGHRQVVGTDESWQAGPSDVAAERPVRRRDDRRAAAGRRLAAARLRRRRDGPASMSAATFDPAALAPYIEPARRPSRGDRARCASGRRRPGRTLVDFGQNLVGWLRFTVRGERGSTITIRHAEVLEDGELGVRPLRSARRRTGSSCAAATTASSRP